MFELKTIEPIELSAYKGSTFRVAFGHSFKKVVYALRTKDCSDCRLKEHWYDWERYSN
jgi:hypothetical protein